MSSAASDPFQGLSRMTEPSKVSDPGGQCSFRARTTVAWVSQALLFRWFSLAGRKGRKLGGAVILSCVTSREAQRDKGEGGTGLAQTPPDATHGASVPGHSHADTRQASRSLGGKTRHAPAPLLTYSANFRQRRNALVKTRALIWADGRNL